LSRELFLRLKYENEAMRLLHECGELHGPITSPPVPFEHIATSHLGLTYEVIDTKMLLGMELFGAVLPEERLVIIDKRCVGSPMYGFTFCHELGHYYLHGTGAAGLHGRRITCKSVAFREKVSRAERQANRFAAALLMPEYLLRPQAAKMNLDVLTNVGRLAWHFRASTQAMTYRLQELGLLGD